MSVESTAPHNANSVYAFLLGLAVVAALTSFSMIGWIAFSYVTDEERRNPPEPESHAEASALMPSFSLVV